MVRSTCIHRASCSSRSNAGVLNAVSYCAVLLVVMRRRRRPCRVGPHHRLSRFKLCTAGRRAVCLGIELISQSCDLKVRCTTFDVKLLLEAHRALGTHRRAGWHTTGDVSLQRHTHNEEHVAVLKITSRSTCCTPLLSAAFCVT
jgi:hypothetical protein